MTRVLEASSKDGVTVGLIDALITIGNVLVKRPLYSDAVREALLDLHKSSLGKLLNHNDDAAMAIIHSAAAKLSRQDDRK